MAEKVGSIQAWHDHYQKTLVEVMDKVSSMESWMTKFDNDILTITGFLSSIEPLLPSIHVPPTQKSYVATIGCGDGGGEVHIVEGRAETERSMEGGTMEEKKSGWKAGGGEDHGNKGSKRKNVVESLPVEAKPHMIYFGFSQFMDEDTGIEKVHLPSGARSSKSDKMKPKALHEDKPKDMSTRGI